MSASPVEREAASAAQPETMRAIVRERYGPPHVLQLRTVETPSIAPDEVLLRVHAAGVNPADWYTVTGPIFARAGSGWRKPVRTRVGSDAAGRVVAVGSDVGDLHPGDEVFGIASGAYGEYAAASAARLEPKPARLSFEEAAAVPIAGVTALQALRDHARVQPGQRVLINGASGGVGTFAVQLAKAFGAEVTAVCSTRNVELVRSLGADRVVDYKREDFTRAGVRHDVMLDIAGGRSFRQLRRAMAPDGTVVLIGGGTNYASPRPLLHVAATIAVSRRRSPRVTFFVAKVSRDDLLVLAGLLEAGTIKAVIDRGFSLEDAAAALAYLGEGHARGKVVISV